MQADTWDLTAQKKKLSANLPKSFSTKRFGPWFLIYKPKNKNIFKFVFTLFNSFGTGSWAKLLQEIPLRRFALDLYELGPSLLLLYIVSVVFTSFQPAVNLYYSNKLLKVVESSLTTAPPHASQVVTATAMRLSVMVLLSCCDWVANKIQPMYFARVKSYFKKRSMEAHVHQDLFTSQSKGNGLKGDIDGVALELLESCLGLLANVVSAISQLAVVIQILKGREGAATLFLLPLLQLVVKSRISNSLWDFGGVYWVDDAWWLRATALFYTAVAGGYQQEILGGGLGKYFIREYEKAEKQNSGSIDSDMYSAYYRHSTPLRSIALRLLDELPMVYLAWSSIAHPQKFSLASLAILTQTHSALGEVWQSISNCNNDVISRFARLQHLYAALDAASDTDAGIMPYPKNNDSAKHGMEIALQDVTFYYPGAADAEDPRAAVRNVSFTLPASSMVVIVGENGSGKSSLVKILSGLYRPTSGTVSVDGTIVKEYKSGDLADVTALLTQDHSIFPLTIGENIGIGDPDCATDMIRITEAAELGGAEGFIKKFEFGYNEVIHHMSTACATTFPLEGEFSELQKLYDSLERYGEISGGEAQRLAAARTFMRLTSGRIKLLIADEPTSAMDPAGEFQLFERLRAMRTGKTLVFVTHRFGHLTKHADLILCMKDGELVESGTHRELIEKKGEYQRLYNIQAQAFVEV